jgi:hypothetical protein
MASRDKKSSKKVSSTKKKTNQNKNVPRKTPPKGMSQERYDRLVAESQAPYKGFRKFIYASLGASGAVGGFIFFTKILAGREVVETLPNLALQIGVVALMVFLFRWEDRDQEES